MSSLIIRHARLVPVHAGDDVPHEPIDVLVEDGTVTAVGPGLGRPAGVEESDAAGRWLVPGLWDQHVHLGQWTLASQRLDLATARSPEDAARMVAERIAEWPDHPVIGWGHRSGGWDRDVTVSELDAVSGDTPVVLISGDGHHAWLNTDRAAPPRAAGAGLGGARGGVVRGVRPALHAWSATTAPRPRPTGAPSSTRPRRASWASSTSSSAAAPRSGPRAGRRARTCCGSGWRATPRASRT